jgi:hypothetical protein
VLSIDLDSIKDNLDVHDRHRGRAPGAGGRRGSSTEGKDVMRRSIVGSIVALVLGTGAMVLAADRPHPFEKARAGQFILERLTKPDGKKTAVRFCYEWIDRVEERKVHLRAQLVSSDGMVGLEPSIEAVIDLDQKLPDPLLTARTATTSEETVRIKDNDYRCTKLEIVRDQDDKRMTEATWTTSEVPLGGIVRRVCTDPAGVETERMEVIDFGDSGGAERVVARAAAPKTEPPKTEPPKTEPPRSEPPKDK